MITTSNTTSSTGLPLVALIGPTNAGKSTLFNRLTGSWQAVTAKEVSTTRDRIYGEVEWQGNRFSLVDCGGLAADDSELYQQIHAQMLRAVEEADIVLFVFDATLGLEPHDLQFVNRLRAKKTVWLIANKVDSQKRFDTLSTYDYLKLPSYPVSASTGKGVGDMLEALTEALPPSSVEKSTTPIIALVGRPNVGKSTLLNALTKTTRAVVSPVAGTTRDIVTGSITIDGAEYLLADTAGVRRRGRIELGPESFSVKRTLAAISQASIVLVLLDATEGTTRGDLHLIYYAKALEKPILLVLNKIDLVPAKQVPFYRYLNKFPHVAISAKESTHITDILDWIRETAPGLSNTSAKQLPGSSTAGTERAPSGQ